MFLVTGKSHEAWRKGRRVRIGTVAETTLAKMTMTRLQLIAMMDQRLSLRPITMYRSTCMECGRLEHEKGLFATYCSKYAVCAWLEPRYGTEVTCGSHHIQYVFVSIV